METQLVLQLTLLLTLMEKPSMLHGSLILPMMNHVMHLFMVSGVIAEANQERGMHPNFLKLVLAEQTN